MGVTLFLFQCHIFPCGHAALVYSLGYRGRAPEGQSCFSWISAWTEGFVWVEVWRQPGSSLVAIWVTRAVLQQGTGAARSFHLGLSIPAGLYLCALKGYLGLVFHMFHFNAIWICKLEIFGAFWSGESVLPWDAGQGRSCNTSQWEEKNMNPNMSSNLEIQPWRRKEENGRKAAFGEMSKQPNDPIPF